MDVKKKYARTTPKQLELYVQFMQEHPELLAGKNTPVAPKLMEELWEELTLQLNSENGPTKTSSVWKDILRNWKKQLMFKAGKLKAESVRTGGGANALQGLTTFKEQAVSVFGQVAVCGERMQVKEHALQDSCPTPYSPPFIALLSSPTLNSLPSPPPMSPYSAPFIALPSSPTFNFLPSPPPMSPYFTTPHLSLPYPFTTFNCLILTTVKPITISSSD